MKQNTAWNSEHEKAHGNNWRQWLGHLKDTPARGLELGTFMGESAEWMLDNIFTHPDSRYVCVDTFEGSDEHHVGGVDCSTLEADTCERLSRFAGRVDIFPAYSHDALCGMRLSRQRFDFILVDAAHDALNVLRDSVLGFEVLKIGGVMVWDDYEWHVFPNELDCPKLGVDSFIAAYASRLEIIHVGYQVAARKTAAA